MEQRIFIIVTAVAILVVSATCICAQEPDGPPVFEQQLLAGDPGDDAWFGENVAIEGDTVVVGARREDLDEFNSNYWDNGAVYVYVRDAGVWTLQQKITSDIVEWSLSFGCSVDISGDTLIIGSYYYQSNRGFAEVWSRTAGIWSLQQRLQADPPTPGGNFGFGTAIDGDTAIVGEYNATGAGSAHIYTRIGAVWTLEQAITAPTPDPSDRFGIRVEIEGDTVVVADNQTNGGQAHVFIRDNGTWTLQQTLISSDLNAEHFGALSNLDGDAVLIGDHFADVDTVVDAGAAYVFTRSGGIWTEQQRLVSNDPQQEAYFGRSLNIEGDTAVVAAFKYDLDGMIDAGAAAVFREVNGIWIQVDTRVASDPEAEAEFGISAAISGGTAVVGARFFDHGGFTDAGAADVFLVDNIFVFADGFEDGTNDSWDSVTP